MADFSVAPMEEPPPNVTCSKSVSLHQERFQPIKIFEMIGSKLLPMDYIDVQISDNSIYLFGHPFPSETLDISEKRWEDISQSPSEQLHGPLPLRSFATGRNGSREAKGIATQIPEVLTNSNSFGAKNLCFAQKKTCVGKTTSTGRLDGTSKINANI